MGNTESHEDETKSTRRSHRHSISSDLTVNGTNEEDRRHSVSAPNSRTSSYSPNVPPAMENGGIERGQQVTEETTNQLGYWYLLKNGYTELVNLIIRPPRAAYDLDELGPKQFHFAGSDYERIDFTVISARQHVLQCSHWRPVARTIEELTAFPCMIYLHGNSSCRLEALSVLRTCLAHGVTMVAMDCSGSGKSDGEYISLGYYERDDLEVVIQYLRQQKHVSTIGLWGRSMGAATALLHADRDPTIAGIIVDSAFAHLDQLVQEIVERGRQEGYTIPGFVVKIVMKFIRSSVLKRAQFDIKSLAPIDHASMSYVPALFVAAKGDDFIAPHHSDQIYAVYAGDKNIVKVRGDHNSIRPQFLLDSAGNFIQTALRVDPRLVPDPTAVAATRGARTPWTRSTMSTRMLMLMDLDVALHGRNVNAPGGHATLPPPRAQWACSTCTFVNPPFHMQCEMCQTTFRMNECALLASEVSSSIALTTPSPPPPPPPMSVQAQSTSSRKTELQDRSSPTRISSSPNFVGNRLLSDDEEDDDEDENICPPPHTI